PQLTTYWEEGYFRVESPDLTLLGDLGPFGAAPVFAGHNHADFGSFVLWIDDRPMIVDPGTYTYRSDAKANGVDWRDHMRSSLAHNTVTVDRLSHARPVGEVGYESLPTARIHFAGQWDDLVVVAGESDAYAESAGLFRRLFVLLGRR